uniref:G_PROTEIN_RECEP_F1_2 domain-containing protein n=1 Tax=Panagrellus redivivus TaxID=6233 RepID=A0A7E4VGB4_PANRE
MSRTMRSLFLASAVYIISNFVVTVTEIRFLLSGDTMEYMEIAEATYQYHWLYLFVYADIIIHPVILINRLTVMYATHRRFWLKLKNFRFGEYISDIILRLHHRFYPKADWKNGFVRAQYRKTERVKQPNPYSTTEESIRHRIEARRPTDSELEDMLKILEMQRNAPHLM